MSRYFKFPPGATPLSDCSGLIPKWVYHLSDLNRVEAENIAAAQRVYLRQPVQDLARWFHVRGLKAIHRAMFARVWTWAGVFRTSVTSIGIDPRWIPSRLAELCHEVVLWEEHPVELTLIEKAARIHHRLVLIHPFENGNGRFSRLVADRCLLGWKCAHPMWPDALNHQGTARRAYIQALQSADRGDYDPLVHFMRELGAREPIHAI